jgi:hypothetical protein
MVVQVIFDLPEAISAEPEILGRSDPIALDEFTGRVSTPSDYHLQPAREYWEMVDWEWADSADLEPPAELTFRMPPGQPAHWGWVSKAPEYGVGINALLLALDTDRRLIKADFYGWFGTLTDWLQAYTSQILMPQSSENGLPSRSIRAWRLTNGGAEEAGILFPQERPDTPPWILVTPAIWEASVRRSSAKDELPLNWQLLGDSLRALRAGQPRRAVVESFTALEVTVRQAIRSRVELCGDQAVADIIIAQRNTLGPLLTMARKLGISLPDHLTSHLVELRNSVVHRGNLPSPIDALTIWQAIHSFAQQQSPLPLL